MPERGGLRVGQWIGLAATAVLLVGLLILPKFQSQYDLLTYTRFLVLALMAQGWNLIGGFTGYAAFWNVGFFGFGAFTTRLFVLSKFEVPFFSAPFFLALFVRVITGLFCLSLLPVQG